VKERFIINSLRQIAVSMRRSFAVFITMLFSHIFLKHRLNAIHDLTCAFSDKSQKEVARLAKESYASAAIVVVGFWGWEEG